MDPQLPSPLSDTLLLDPGLLDQPDHVYHRAKSSPRQKLHYFEPGMFALAWR